MDIKNYINVKENFLDDITNKRLLKWVKNDVRFVKGSIVGSPSDNKFQIDQNVRKVQECFINNDPRHKLGESSLTSVFWYNYLVHSFIKVMGEFFHKYNVPIQQIDPDMHIGIFKYEQTDYYVPHIDYHKTTPRHYSFSYVINDEYEGGDFQFTLANNEEVIIKPKANSCIMFPSNFMFPHAIKKINSGTRYVAVGWMH
jgi:hypothetical protein|tara:strand:+ start:1867 stop:2463 length:597 start_codon:yes stop_codon:yes gene_type:complete